MTFQLDPLSEARGYRLRAFDTIGSTSAEALSLARDGEAGPLWVCARQQTAGRGRRGRVWQTARGNLAASLMLRTGTPPLVAASLGFVAGLALIRALRACCGPTLGDDPGVAFALKWPNDVLANGAKVAGILLDAESSPDASRPIVIGIGVNVVSAPHDAPYPVTSLADLGFAVSAETLFEALSDAWVTFADLWDEGAGLGAIRRAWLASAAGLGAPVSVRHGAELVQGLFETIDDHGRLVVRLRDGAMRLIAAGDVHFGSAATMPVATTVPA